MDGEEPEIERRLNETLDLDPAFALAYALRAKTRIWMSGKVIDDDDAKDRLNENARADIARALALQPDLPEAWRHEACITRMSRSILHAASRICCALRRSRPTMRIHTASPA